MTNSDVLSEILRQYGTALKANPQLRSLALKAANGSLTVAEAQRAAGLTGKLLGELMADGLGGLAGDGALALTDALAVVPPSLRRNHKFVSSLIRGLEKDGELWTAVPAFDVNRARNLAKYASEFEKFEDHKLDFKELVENNSRSIVDESQKGTGLARREMGYTPTITRSTVGETCDYCNDLSGTREYNPQSMDKSIFSRHRNCDCLIELNRNGGTEVVNNYTRPNSDVSPELTKQREKLSNTTLPSGEKTGRGIDVTAEYFGKATPGKGDFEQDEGVKPEDVRVAHIIHNTLGGDIRVQKDVNQDHVKTADYLWNGKLWELKTTSTDTAVKSAMQTGLRQIRTNPGGIVIAMNGEGRSLKKTIDNIENRFYQGHVRNVDVMIIHNDSISKILRYKK